MPKFPKLTEAEVAVALKDVPGWSVKDAKLHREYEFEDFTHAFGFMAATATVIEKLNHHPEWFNVWNRVRIDLTTHDSSGITKRDFDLAQAMERLARKLL
jgi:4a-hydroxytetrahydrobiopterin dehydratase